MKSTSLWPESSLSYAPPNRLQHLSNILSTCHPLVCSLIPLPDAIATKWESTCGYSQLRHLAKKSIGM